MELTPPPTNMIRGNAKLVYHPHTNAVADQIGTAVINLLHNVPGT
jgi:hypothetical protein